MKDTQAAGRDAENSEWLDHVARAGLVAYGTVHLLIGWLALQLAFGEAAKGDASSTGALRTVAQQPLGEVLIWLIAIGMWLMVLWRLTEAAFGHQDESDENKRWRKRAMSLGKAILYGTIAWTAIQIATSTGSQGGSGGGTESMTARLMNLPGGQLIVGLVALGILAYGARLIYQGWTEGFKDHLDAEGKSGDDGSAYVMLGKVGYIAKGVAIMLIGGLFMYAAITHQAKKSGGLDQALQTVLGYPFGQAVVVAIGLGLAAYGLFSFARARHLSR